MKKCWDELRQTLTFKFIDEIRYLNDLNVLTSKSSKHESIDPDESNFVKTIYKVNYQRWEITWLTNIYYEQSFKGCLDKKIILKVALENLGELSFLSHWNYDVNSLQINQVFKTLAKCKTCFSLEKDTFNHNEILWNNRNIKTDGKKLLVYKSWFEKKNTYIYCTCRRPPLQ